ncbi:Uncharacterized protein Adt_14556 [Abeliophyllum distichum]|uniref:Uncharacterized protein n=1 Tax=Abeliophyllum distichum TaxID=126358 RepID=A0ABD1TZZ7_9LAMI
MVRFSTAWEHHYLDRFDPEIYKKYFPPARVNRPKLASTSRSSVDSTAGGSIHTRSSGDLHDLYETMSEQFIMWPDIGLQKKAIGMHQVDTNSLVLAKIDALAKQMDSLKHSQSANMI